MKRVLLFFADGAEEIEALTPVDILRRAGAEVTVVGLGDGINKGSHGISVVTDKNINNIGERAEFDMLVLPGGSVGTENLYSSPLVRLYIKRAFDEDKWVAAICAAPTILGRLGYLKGKRAVCYPGLEDKLLGAEVRKETVVTDGRIITAAGAGVSVPFSLSLITALYGDAAAVKIKNTILAG